jgi:hypothetical protein
MGSVRSTAYQRVMLLMGRHGEDIPLPGRDVLYEVAESLLLAEEWDTDTKQELVLTQVMLLELEEETRHRWLRQLALQLEACGPSALA